MTKTIKFSIGLVLAIILIFLGYRHVNNLVKTKVAERLSDQYGINHQEIRVGLWDGFIKIDSISGVGERGSISRANIVDLNWYKLYRKNTIELENLCFILEDITTWTKDRLHKLTVEKAVMKNSHLFLEGVSFRAPLGVDAFMNAAEFRKPRYDITIPRIDVKGISDSPIKVKLIELQDANIHLAEDLNLPISGKKKKLLAQLISDIKTEFSIDSIAIKNSRLTYSVKDKGSDQRGEIAFTNLDIDISNVSNDSITIAKNKEMIVDLTSAIENDGKLTLIMKHFLDSPTYHYDAYANLNNFSLINANEVLNAAKNIDIEQGSINSLELEGSFHDYTSEGELKVDYKDLKIDLNKNLAGIANFLGNAMIKKDGKESITFNSARNVNKSFLVHIWQSVLESLKKIALVI